MITEAETGVRQPQAVEHREPPKAAGGKGQISPGLSLECNHFYTLILNLPTEL